MNEDSTFVQTIGLRNGRVSSYVDIRRFNIDVHVIARIKLEQALKLTPLFKGDERKRSQDQLVVNVFQRLFQKPAFHYFPSTFDEEQNWICHFKVWKR